MRFALAFLLLTACGTAVTTEYKIERGSLSDDYYGYIYYGAGVIVVDCPPHFLVPTIKAELMHAGGVREEPSQPNVAAHYTRDAVERVAEFSWVVWLDPEAALAFAASQAADWWNQRLGWERFRVR